MIKYINRVEHLLRQGKRNEANACLIAALVKIGGELLEVVRRYQTDLPITVAVMSTMAKKLESDWMSESERQLLNELIPIAEMGYKLTSDEEPKPEQDAVT